jgi:hypothetical protein
VFSAASASLPRDSAYRISPVQKLDKSQEQPGIGGAPLIPPVQAYPPLLLILHGCPVFGQVSACAFGLSVVSASDAVIAAMANP